MMKEVRVRVRFTYFQCPEEVVCMKVLSVPEAEHSLSAEGVYLLLMPPLGFWTPRSYLRVPRCVQLWTPAASRGSL